MNSILLNRTYEQKFGKKKKLIEEVAWCLFIYFYCSAQIYPDKGNSSISSFLMSASLILPLFIPKVL